MNFISIIKFKYVKNWSLFMIQWDIIYASTWNSMWWELTEKWSKNLLPYCGLKGLQVISGLLSNRAVLTTLLFKWGKFFSVKSHNF